MIGRYAWIGSQKCFAHRFTTVKNENYRSQIIGVDGFNVKGDFLFVRAGE